MSCMCWRSTIISLLLHYGMVEEDFEDLVVKVDDKGEITLGT